MGTVDRLLEYVQKINPTMTREKLMKELRYTSEYGIVALNFASKNTVT